MNVFIIFFLKFVSSLGICDGNIEHKTRENFIDDVICKHSGHMAQIKRKLCKNKRNCFSCCSKYVIPYFTSRNRQIFKVIIIYRKK